MSSNIYYLNLYKYIQKPWKKRAIFLENNFLNKLYNNLNISTIFINMTIILDSINQILFENVYFFINFFAIPSTEKINEIEIIKIIKGDDL